MNFKAKLVLFSLILWSVCGCATTSAPSTQAQYGQTIEPASSPTWLERAREPGQVVLTRIKSARWAVDRAGLINLEHKRALAAGLEDGLQPIEISCYVLEHPTAGRFLIDSGVAQGFRDPETTPVSWLVAQAIDREHFKVERDTAQVLRALGPVQGVFLTHMHFDHIMGLPDVPASVPVFVGPGEPQARRAINLVAQGTTDRLVGKHALKELRFGADPLKLVDGVLDLFGDGSVYALHMPGHSPGSVAFVVRTAQGTKLIAGDVSHTRWGWEHGVEPGEFNDDAEESAVSFNRLQRVAAQLPGVEVLFGHTH